MFTRLVRIAKAITGTPRPWGTFPTCRLGVQYSARRARYNRAPLIGLALAIVLTGASAVVAAEGHAPATPSAHGAGHGGPDINPLDFKADLAVWTAVVFLVLLAILAKFAWRPIADALEKRERRVEEQIASAERANLEARQLLAEYHKKLAEAESEVRGIIERGRRDAEQLGRKMLDETREESRREKERALREIDAATAEALKELAERSADLAIELAGKIVETKMDRTQHARLIEQAVAGFATYSPLPPRERSRG